METVLSTTFWNNIIYAMKITAPLMRVLRLVDGEKKPPTGYIYEAIDRAKEAIKEAMGGQRNERRYKPIWNIIDKRWDVQLYQPLHAARYIINPEFYYNNQDIELCEEGSIDPIILRDIDECNEWFIGSMQELVHEDDDLTWDQVVEASKEMNSAPDKLGPALIGKGEVQVEAREEWLKKNHHLRQMKQMTKNYTLMRIMMA
ncbi:hypothetical protein HHK36_003143 [Tetracentron sinense]|uniref:Uncharacterized protein n=1 Tax=Tetracentron sinense TaxID=13715 RepID=A0A835DP23_TETSI|nr:hypothetical protein HHK36_003143 [Tetracentron sinense]